MKTRTSIISRTPPIVLDVAHSAIPASFSHPLNEKMQLLEGHHRFAMAMKLPEENGQIEHDFWIVIIVSGS